MTLEKVRYEQLGELIALYEELANRIDDLKEMQFFRSLTATASITCRG